MRVWEHRGSIVDDVHRLGDHVGHAGTDAGQAYSWVA